MKATTISIAIASIVLGFSLPCPAQLPGGGQPGVNAAMLKLFGDIPGFTAKADVRLQDKATKDLTTMTMGFAMLDNKVRLELDMTQVKSRQITKESLATLKNAGLDKLATVVRPDRKTAILIYPVIGGYVEMPMSRDEVTDMERIYSIAKTRIGKETIDGHPCEKTKVTLAASSGASQEATVWYATDLRDFPVKIEMNQPEALLVMLYKEVKLIRPDARLFEPPAGFTRHGNIELLMQSAVFKALGGPGK